jgi:hypothetical protein
MKNHSLTRRPFRKDDRDIARVSPSHSRALLERGIAHIDRFQTVYGVIVVITVSFVATVLTAQGWRSRIPAPDLVTVIRAAHAFVSTGALPEHADVGSYGSFNTPGPAWLMMPSTLLFHDPRLSEYIGAALLHLLTLAGVFLLGRKYFGTWCGCLAVVLYGLSAQGLWWAGSLWTFGSPDMFVLLAYLASEWVTRRDGRFLAAAVGAYALGMYVDLALAPAIAMLPVIWLGYRPPVTLKPLLAAGAVLLIIWFPYLRFEAGRNFADLRSQFLLENILPSNVSRSWCDPARKLKAWPVNARAPALTAHAAAPTGHPIANASTSSDSRFGRLESGLESRFRDRLLGNFLVTRLSARDAVGTALLLSVLASLVLLCVPGSPRGSRRSDRDPPVPEDGHRRPKPRLMSRLALGSVVLAIGTWFVLRQLVFTGQLPSVVRGAVAILLLAGVALIFSSFTQVTDRLLRRAGVHIQSEEQARRRRLVVVALGVPWLVLIALAEPGVPERFLWLLPLQVLVLAAFFTVLLPRLGVPRPVIWLAQGLLVFVFLWNAFLIDRVDAWRADGWSGHDAAEVRAVDYIAADLHREGRDRASIGYRVFVYPFMVNYHSVSPNYKVGSQFDVLFQYQHGIENIDRCAEGVSPGDDYRIVQTRPLNQEDPPINYFNVSLGNRFKLVRQIGTYRVFKATREGS